MKQTSIPDFYTHRKQVSEPQPKRKSLYPDSLQPSIKPDPAQKKSLLSIPPSKVSALSSSTLSIINSIHSSHPKQVRSFDEILNSFPPREKYQDLVDPCQKLPFPYKFNRLLQIQSYTDTVINNFRTRNLIPVFSSIKECISNTYHAYVELEHIQKLCYLIPGFYALRRNLEDELVVDLPVEGPHTLCDLHVRTVNVREKLMIVLKEMHREHLKSLGISFDPDVCRTWHSSFDLHRVGDIQMAELPNFVKESGGKGLARVGRLVSLCGILGKVYRRLKTPSLFFKGLIKKVLDERNGKWDEKEVETDVIEVSEMFGEWISIIKTDSGEVVRMNRSFGFSLKSAEEKLKMKYL